MNVAEALATFSALTGSQIEVEGFLVHLGGAYYIAPNATSKEVRERSIVLTDHQAIAQLRSTVGMWVGGPAYQDDVRLVGIVRASSDERFPAQIDTISSFSLTRRGETLQIM